VQRYLRELLARQQQLERVAFDTADQVGGQALVLAPDASVLDDHRIEHASAAHNRVFDAIAGGRG
jgi:hypothetical protein